MQIWSKCLFAVLLFILSNSVLAQTSQIRDEFRAETINAVLRLLKEKYAYPEIALKMEREINERAKRGEYDSFADGEKLAEK